jgi:cytidyltransferase-like protein
MAIVAITSLYANPLHPGHIDCLNRSKALADQLWVIVNNDHQAEQKRGTKSFQNEQVRMQIVAALRLVDRVILAEDTDSTVCRTLERLILEAQQASNIVIFTKGGDRFATEIPERDICKRYNARIVDGLGEKLYSSSDFVRRLSIGGDPQQLFKTLQQFPLDHHQDRYLEVGERDWGAYYVLEEGKGFKVKKLFVKSRHRLSLQSHTQRNEHWTVVEGEACVQIRQADDPTWIGHRILRANEGCYIQAGQIHRLGNDSDGPLVVIEVQTGPYLGEDDITRYEDDYHRESPATKLTKQARA